MARKTAAREFTVHNFRKNGEPFDPSTYVIDTNTPGYAHIAALLLEAMAKRATLPEQDTNAG